MLAVAAVAVGAGVVGLAGEDSGDDVAVQPEAPSTAPPDADAAGTFPHFDAAPGWEAVQVGAAATAADIPLGPESAAGSVPWDTVERLEVGDVVLFAMSTPAGEVSGGGFPPSELPLSLDAAQPGGLEGQPDDVYAERLQAEVDGWNIDLVAFYAAPGPDADTRAAAQSQLDRLVVPARAAPAAPEASRAAAGTCQPSDLQAQVALADAGGGALAGHITVRNVGASACSLAGPVGQVEPRDTSSTVIPSTVSEAEPAWSQAGEPEPAGWPAVAGRPGVGGPGRPAGPELVRRVPEPPLLRHPPAGSGRPHRGRRPVGRGPAAVRRTRRPRWSWRSDRSSRPAPPADHRAATSTSPTTPTAAATSLARPAVEASGSNRARTVVRRPRSRGLLTSPPGAAARPRRAP